MSTVGFGGPEIGFIEPGGGDGSAVDTVNGVAPVLGDVTLTASDIPSTGPSDVQADLDALKFISSAGDLQTRFPAVGGVHTMTEGVPFRIVPGGPPIIDLGLNQIELVNATSLVGEGSKVTIQSAAVGPAVFGSGSLDNVSIVQVSFDPASMCINLDGLNNRVIEITRCALVGQNPGVIDDPLSTVNIQDTALIPLAPGAGPLVISGTIGGLLLDSIKVDSIAGPPRIGIQIPATASVTNVSMDRCLMNTANVGDALFDIHTSVTVPVTETIGTSSCRVEGPGQMFLAGSIDSADVRMVSNAQRNGGDSRWLGDAAFENESTPIIITHTGSPTWDVVPFENAGAVTSLTKNALNQRFELVRRALQDWGIEGRGRTDKRFGGLSWSASVARSAGGGARPFTGRIETRPNGAALWVEVPETKAGLEMAGATPATTGTGAPFEWDKATEFRLTCQGNAGTATAISLYRITPASTQ